MATDNRTLKTVLSEDRIPSHWYNLAADLPEPPAPPLHPGTLQPIGPAELAPLFPMALIAQEVSQEPRIEIPDPVRDVYRLWRPTPLYRARRLERFLDTTARIYYKYEGVSPAGSHKPNTAVPQAYYNKEAGDHPDRDRDRCWPMGLRAGAGRQPVRPRGRRLHGQGELSAEAHRRALMESYGARCVASPSDETEAGRKILAAHPDSTGSLGIAISEAVEMAAKRDDTHYALGSVLSHVLLHQTVIGQEAIDQLEQAGDYPDVVVGCTGGGSNFAGIAFPFLGAMLRGGPKVEVIACRTLGLPVTDPRQVRV